jgi:hypothetical protein
VEPAFLGSAAVGRRESDLEEELRSHIELAAGRLGAEDNSMRLLRIKAGGEAQAMDLLRDQRGLPGSQTSHAICVTDWARFAGCPDSP